MEIRDIDAPIVLGPAGGQRPRHRPADGSVHPDHRHRQHHATGAAGRILMVGGPKTVRVRDQEGNWPTKSDLWCWYCCHPFDTQPLPMPTKHDDRRDVFHVTGNFCSWACMKAHNLRSASYTKSINANTITLFHKRCTGVMRGIRAAPPRMTLAVFGGSMSIEEFRAASGKPLEYTVLPPRMITHHQSVEETDTTYRQHPPVAHKPRARAAPDLSSVVDFKNVSTKNETLRLKRPKPLQNTRNLLERTMGINALGKKPPPPV